MKIHCFALAAALLGSTAFAQTNTYPFPSSGNVGIGTTSPDATLTVNTGSYLLRTAATTTDLELNGFTGGGGWARAFRVGKYGSATYRYGAFGTLGDESGVAYAYMAVPSASEDGTGYNASAKLVLSPSGNVGIGTTNPTRQLSVYNQYAEAVLKSSAGSGGTGGCTLYFGNSSADDAGWLNYDHASNALTVRVNSANRMRIDSNGNVGIGETNPTHKLAVNGTIKAKEVIVETTGWSDYVLARNYKLQSLSDVEAHINDNGHLPGIPSASQVAEQGVSVGDMQAKLLAKVEELTLHIIAQEKKMTAMQAQIEQLQNR